MTGNVHRHLHLCLMTALLAPAACAHREGDRNQLTHTPAPPERPFILTFSETRSYTAVAWHFGTLYAGTPGGLLRFESREKRPTLFTREQGLPGNHIYGLAGGTSSGLWVVTDGGLGRFHEGGWSHFGLPVSPPKPVTPMAASPGGIWVGFSSGLGWLQEGRWKRYLPGARISYLMNDPASAGVWVGTTGEGLYQYKDEEFVPHSPAGGQAIRDVRCITYTAEGALVAVGRGTDGERLSLYDGKVWISYSLSPEARLGWVQQVGDSLLLSHGDRLLVIRHLRPDPENEDKVPQPTGPVRITALPSPGTPADYPVPQLDTELAEWWLPPDPVSLVGTGQTLLLTTRTMGAARFDGRKLTWYRTNDFFGDNDRLRMACGGKPHACYLPAGNGGALRYADGDFKPVGPTPDTGVRVQAFVDEDTRDVVSLHTPAAGRSLVVSRLVGKRFVPLYETGIPVPSGRVEVRFIRPGPAGTLWVGLWYRDAEGDRRAWGVVVLRRPPPLTAQTPQPRAAAGTTPPAGGKAPSVVPPPSLTDLTGESVEPPLVFHRESILADEKRPKGSLALPDDIRDVWFEPGGELWVATGAGVCHVQGQRVTQYTENDGLASEIVYAVARSPEAEILVATLRGLGRFEGKEWRFDLGGPLSWPARTLMIRGQALWIGSTRGVLHRQGGRFRTVGAKVGLAGDNVRDLYLERDHRLWVLTDQGVSLVNLAR